MFAIQMYKTLPHGCAKDVQHK